MLTDIFYTIAVVFGAWVLLVFIGFHFAGRLIHPTSSSGLIRILYLLYFTAFAVWIFFLSPFRKMVETGKSGFWILLIVYLFISVWIIINWSSLSRRRSA